MSEELKYVGQKKYSETTDFVEVVTKGTKTVVRKIVAGEPVTEDFQVYKREWIPLKELKKRLK